MRASDRAYETLRAEILEGGLEPGTVLAEVEQSTRLGVSRTPLREALSRLAADGLVAGHSGRGLVVTTVSTEHITELFEVREALEVKAARLAALKRDPAVFEELRAELAGVDALLDDSDPARRAYYDLVGRLDSAIDNASGNRYLVASLDNVRTHIARIRRLSHDNPERLRAAAAEHLMIVEAIADGSETLAAYATELHLHRSLKNILGSVLAARPS